MKSSHTTAQNCPDGPKIALDSKCACDLPGVVYLGGNHYKGSTKDREKIHWGSKSSDHLTITRQLSNLHSHPSTSSLSPTNSYFWHNFVYFCSLQHIHCYICLEFASCLYIELELRSILISFQSSALCFDTAKTSYLRARQQLIHTRFHQLHEQLLLTWGSVVLLLTSTLK